MARLWPFTQYVRAADWAEWFRLHSRVRWLFLLLYFYSVYTHHRARTVLSWVTRYITSTDPIALPKVLPLHRCINLQTERTVHSARRTLQQYETTPSVKNWAKKTIRFLESTNTQNWPVDKEVRPGIKTDPRIYVVVRSRIVTNEKCKIIF